MNIFRIAAELILIYVLYKIIFEFIVPLYQSTKKIRKQFGEMHNKMQEDLHKYNDRQNSAEPNKTPQREGDYIEFEEVK